MKTNKIRNFVIIICFVFFVLGIGVLSYNYIISKINLTFETVSLEMYGNAVPKNVKKEPIKENNDNTNTSSDQANSSKQYKSFSYDYIGYIDIPKINLHQGLVDVNSRYNNVDRNIQIIVPSQYPDVDKGNFILAAHSGSASISYFKHLYKLVINDKVNILYNGKRYRYNISSIYTDPKDGSVAIYRNITKTTITLITCTKNDESTHTVYIGELEGVDDL